jgi:NitT/TauT family transport system ATP-binding protein
MKIDLADCSVVFEDTAGNQRTVLRKVTLDVAAGEFLVLIGPSGCGKTTLLNVVAGLVPVSSGSVKIDGAAPNPAGGLIGYMFQEYALFPWRTVFRNIEFGLEVRNVAPSERAEKVRHYLDMMRLSPYADHYPSQLSGGMKQRVALARTLVVDPTVLLMDEPFGALDAQTREELQDEILRIHAATGKTIVFVTHSIEESVYLGDRVVVLRGSPSSVVQILRTGRPALDRQFRMADQFFDSCKRLRETIGG